MSKRSKKRRLISELMEGKTVSESERSVPDKFFIQSGNSDFNARQRDIFTGLNQLEMMHDRFQRNIPAPVEMEINNSCDPLPDPRTMDGNFKRPILIPKRHSAKKKPDFVLHPEKWTKYSLADVGGDDMSEKSNTTAAMTFLAECKQQKRSDENESSPTEEDNLDRKIVFQSRKFVMPEYEVGQKPCSSGSSKRARNKPELGVADSSLTNAVHLSHLETEDGDCTDDKSELNKETDLQNDDVDMNDSFSNQDEPPSADFKPKRVLRKRVDDDNDDKNE